MGGERGMDSQGKGRQDRGIYPQIKKIQYKIHKYKRHKTKDKILNTMYRNTQTQKYKNAFPREGRQDRGIYPLIKKSAIQNTQIQKN